MHTIAKQGDNLSVSRLPEELRQHRFRAMLHEWASVANQTNCDLPAHERTTTEGVVGQRIAEHPERQKIIEYLAHCELKRLVLDDECWEFMSNWPRERWREFVGGEQ